MAARARQANQKMVDRLIAEGTLWSPPLIQAFRHTPRHLFLERVYQRGPPGEWQETLVRDAGSEALELIYSDRALITRLSPDGVAISSSSQPSLMAQMLEDLQLESGQRVLEVGTGTGYNAALMAHRVGPHLVHSVDVDRETLLAAHAHLKPFAERGVHLHHADGRLGLPGYAPFDCIQVTAAAVDLEPAWLEQLGAPAGWVLAPLELAPGLAFLACGTVREGTFAGRLTRAAYFMPLRAEQESGEREQPEPAAVKYQQLPAPWADWFDEGRPRLRWLHFSQALVFFGFLRGLKARLGSGEEAGLQGVGDPEQPEVVCWFGRQTWYVHGAQGRDLGWDLWQAFLNAGGPWPTEFQLRARADDAPLPDVGPTAWVRQGPRCRHVWELPPVRTRQVVVLDRRDSLASNSDFEPLAAPPLKTV